MYYLEWGQLLQCHPVSGLIDLSNLFSHPTHWQVNYICSPFLKMDITYMCIYEIILLSSTSLPARKKKNPFFLSIFLLFIIDYADLREDILDAHVIGYWSSFYNWCYKGAIFLEFGRAFQHLMTSTAPTCYHMEL